MDERPPAQPLIPIAVFALPLAGLAVLGLVTGDFAYLWQPVAPWIPGRLVLAYASSALLLGCAAGLLWARARARSSLVLALYGLASTLLVHVPDIAMQPGEEVRWYNLGEVAIIVAGAWIIFTWVDREPAIGWRRVVGGARGTRFARLLFALALLPIGLSHFVYVELTASLVPSWLPGHFGWAYLTGAGHIAAGLAILLGIFPRLGVTLEALMVSVFVVTIHLPGVLGAPGDRDQWTELLVACTVGGVAFLIVHSYRDTRWLMLRPISR